MFRHPAIQEACIIATRDAYRGESVKAVVVLRQDHKGKVTSKTSSTGAVRTWRCTKCPVL
jgi:acyl-coenzyme A synthetase/AMP-(fatty) acid ligase